MLNFPLLLIYYTVRKKSDCMHEMHNYNNLLFSTPFFYLIKKTVEIIRIKIGKKLITCKSLKDIILSYVSEGRKTVKACIFITEVQLKNLMLKILNN